jgi:hypothetical protein
METVCSSETLASTDKSARHQNPEEEHHYPHRRENLKGLRMFDFHKTIFLDRLNETSTAQGIPCSIH